MGSKIDWSGPKTRTQFKIKLSCGHHIRTISDPMRKNALYPCRAGQGCGYRLAWVSYEDTETGRITTNPQEDGKGK